MKFVITLTLTFVFAFAYGQETHPIDEKLEGCLEAANTTADMAGCYAEATAAWDAELNKYYKLYQSELYEENKTVLRDAQRVWITYRDSEAQLRAMHYFKQMGGSLWIVTAADDNMRLVKDRALYLQSRYKELADPESMFTGPR